MLILDEPTSGVDPLARDQFWELLIDLSRNQGVTIFVSTHFMNEAARCDRISLMDQGRVLATDTPAASDRGARRRRRWRKLLSAFSKRQRGCELSRRKRHRCRRCRIRRTAAMPAAKAELAPSALRRLLAYAIREALELLRDPIRLVFRAARHRLPDADLRLRHLDGC